MRVNIDKPWRIEGYSDFLSSLDILEILRHYGTPSTVLLYYHPPVEPNNGGFYFLWILYKQHGFVVEYLAVKPKPPKLCPLRAVDNHVEAIEVYLGGLDQFEYPLDYRFANELDPVEFYQQLSVSNQCMELPEEVWR
jgi:hypothetical protein